MKDENREAVDIGDRLELFVDRALIDSMDDVGFFLHEPHEVPTTTSGFGGAYMTVLHDEGLLRAYFRRAHEDYKGDRFDGNHGEYTAYGQSRDGCHWDYPDIGGRGNVVLQGESPFSHNFSPFIDNRPGCPPEAKYKALAGVAKREFVKLESSRKEWEGGLYAFHSADGVNWQLSADKPVIAEPQGVGLCFDSQNVGFWSIAEQCYVCYFRTRASGHGSLRAISRMVSKDFLHWDCMEHCHANFPGEHLYTSQAHPYYRAPHIYIALPTRFQPERGASTDILFMAARAGEVGFTRLFPEAFIRPGLDPARWGNRSNYAALNVVPVSATEMAIFHCKTGSQLRLRTDGFVSLRAGFKEGTVTTRSVTFSGDQLYLNASTSAGGSVRVALLQPDGAPYSGFAAEDCQAVVGDGIALEVKWADPASLRAINGQPVRIQFTLHECDLYSYRFGR